MAAILIETLRWWSKWRRGGVSAVPAVLAETPRAVIVYLSGCSDYANTNFTDEQCALLDALARAHPRCLVLRRPFPFVAAGEPECGIAKIASGGAHTRPNTEDLVSSRQPPIMLASLRNAWQGMLATLPCIARLYGRDVANRLAQELRHACPAYTSGQPGPALVLIGVSIGAQLAIVSAARLGAQRRCTVYLIALGGVHGAGTGLDSIAHLYAVSGRRDGWRHLSLAFPGRWLLLRRWTAYGRALTQGRLSRHSTGVHSHYGPRGYLSGRTVPGSDRSYLERTFEAIEGLDLWRALDANSLGHSNLYLIERR